MKPTPITLFVALLFMLSGCKSKSPGVKYMPMETDITIKTVHTERVDTVFVEVPAQSAERTTASKTSHLETDYAASDARINEDGTLTHTLFNKTAKLPVPVKNATDTVYVDKAIEKPVPVEVPKEVERELTWWQKTRLNTWGWIVLALAISTGWNFRKPIMYLARRALGSK